MITDNELRAHLVDTLPVGASLVVRLVPLCLPPRSRAHALQPRLRAVAPRASNEKRNRMVRRLALPTDSPSSPCTTRSRIIYQSARTSPTCVHSRRTSIDAVYSPVLSLRQAPSPRSPLSPRKSPASEFRPAPWSSPVALCQTLSPPVPSVPAPLAFPERHDQRPGTRLPPRARL